MNKVTFQIAVPVAPHWPNIELLRTSVLTCLATIFHDNEFCQSVGMITSELLENAVKYGDWSNQDRSLFNLKVSGSGESVEVEVCNPVDSGNTDLGTLMETVAFIESFESPEAAYQQRLQQLASDRTVGSTDSRLGLTRIAYEGDCHILASVDENSVLHVRTRSRH